jgi:hypothetical protein
MDETNEPDAPITPSLAELAAEANRRKARGREGKPAVDHDTRCDNQDAAVREVARKADDLAKELHRDELRVERLIGDVENLIGRVPEHLGADLATLSGQVTTVSRDVEELKRMLRADFVTRAELDPIKRLVYGVVGLILTGVIGGLLGLVILK